MYNPSHSFDFLKSWLCLWAQPWKVLDTPQSGRLNQNQTFLLVWVVFHCAEQNPFLLSSCPFSTSLIREQRSGSGLFSILPPPSTPGAAELKKPWEKLRVVCLVHFLWVRRRPWGRLRLGGSQTLSQLLLSQPPGQWVGWTWNEPEIQYFTDILSDITVGLWCLATSKPKHHSWKLVASGTCHY